MKRRKKCKIEKYIRPGVPERFSEYSDIHLYCGRCGSSVGIRSVCKKKMLKLHHLFDIFISYDFILCNASNRTIRPEFGMHHRPYGRVVRIQPIDYVHRSSNYFHNIYYHIYPFQPIYQFSIHQTCNQ